MGGCDHRGSWGNRLWMGVGNRGPVVGRSRGCCIAMSKIASFLMVTLDGYYEGKNPWEIDWHNVEEEFNEFSIQQLDASDCLIFGRTTYLGMAQYWPGEEALQSDPATASRMNDMPKFVVSRSLESPEWSNTRVVRDAKEFGDLRQQFSKDLLVLGSSGLTTSLMEIGLLDELRVMINPVLIGGGKSLSNTAARRIPLKLLSTREFRNGNVLLTYQPS